MLNASKVMILTSVANRVADKIIEHKLYGDAHPMFDSPIFELPMDDFAATALRSGEHLQDVYYEAVHNMLHPLIGVAATAAAIDCLLSASAKSTLYPNHNRMYHCTYHCIEVAEFVRALAYEYGGPEDDGDRLAVILAALFHDYEHSLGATSDTENVMRAQRAVDMFLPLILGLSDRPEFATDKFIELTLLRAKAAIELTVFEGGAFKYRLPLSSHDSMWPMYSTVGYGIQLGDWMRSYGVLLAQADASMVLAPTWGHMAFRLVYEMLANTNAKYNPALNQMATFKTYLDAQVGFMFNPHTISRVPPSFVEAYTELSARHSFVHGDLIG